MKLQHIVIIFTVLVFSTSSKAAEKLLTIMHTNSVHNPFQGLSPQMNFQPLHVHADKTTDGCASVARSNFNSDVNQKKHKRDKAQGKTWSFLLPITHSLSPINLGVIS
jgi:hypothetical protein